MSPAADAAVRPRPQLLRLRFSHYCRKAEACLVQAGLPYDALDLSLTQFPLAVGAGTVPVLRVGDRLLADSADVVAWADANAAPDAVPLRAADPAVQEWMAWADEEVGPVARRQAYRCVYHAPRQYAKGRPLLAAGLRLWRPLVLRALKAYKTRRFDDHDAEAGPRIVARVADALEATGTGYLVGDHPTAADHAVANLMAPLVKAGPWAGLDAEPGWQAVAAYVEENRLKGENAARRRKATGRRVSEWSTLPTAAE